MKKISYLFFVLILGLSISGCSQKKIEEEIIYSKDSAEFIYQLILYKKYGKCDIKNPENYYLSDFAYRLATKKQFSQNGLLSLFEKYNPDYIGYFDSINFYVPAVDTADWVDSAIDYGELEKFLGIIGISEELETEEFDEDVFDQNKEIRFFDKDGKLKILKLNSEVFIPQYIGENLVLVNSGKKYIRRNVYDKQFRLITAEKWLNNSTKSKRIAVENYTYFPESVKINTREILSDSQTERITYNQDGLMEKQELYDVKIVKSQRKETFAHSYSWNYDSQKRVTYEGESELINGRRESSSTNYFYRKDEVKPDTDYYENGVLKIRTRYSSNSTYTQTIYFEDEMSVQTFYENYKKVKDIYYIGDIVLRENVYE